MNTEMMEERARMLEDNDIYVKPDSGSAASQVMRLSYEDDQMKIRSADPNVVKTITAYADHDVHRRARTASQGESLQYEDNQLPLQDARRPGVPKINIKQEQIQDSSQSLTIDTTDIGLEQTLFELEQLYHMNGTISYAETALNPLLIEGNTWEIRTINQYNFLGEREVTAAYAKVGSDDVVANISRGGEGIKPRKAATRAFKGHETAEDVADQFINDVYEASNEIARTLDSFIAKITGEEFYLDKRFTDVAIDFMPDDTGTGIEPRLVDINPDYGMSGLHEEGYKRVQWAKAAIHDKYQRRIREQGATKA